MPQPTPVTQRIEAMDMLRGVAVLGILLLNINSFALPLDAAFGLTGLGYQSESDAWVYAIVSALGAGKFMSLFALLFGAGVSMMVDRRREKCVPTAGLHYRRLAVLAGLGFLHGVFIWYGDILLPYAICGAVLYPLLLMPSRHLVWVCAGLWVLALACALGFGALSVWGESFAVESESSALIFQNEAELMRGGVLGIMKVRVVHWLVFMTLGSVLALPWALALMVTGVLACRSGWITMQRSRGAYVRLLGWTLGLGLTIAATRLVLEFWGDLLTMLLLQPVMNVMDAALLSVAWASIVMLCAKALAPGWLGRALIAVGRMALTNYLAQSVICTMLFYGYGFGLFGSLSRTALLGVVAFVWALQLLWSPWWLKHHERGPLEAVWRRLTYGRG